MKRIIIVAVFLLSLTTLALAADSPSGLPAHPDMHGQHGRGMMGGPVNSMPSGEANKAYMKSMQGMHAQMMQGIMDPDPDVAFAKGMYAHHQGAIDMAKVQLQYGKDPEMKKLAEGIIAAQEKEMELMKKWLEKRQANK